MHQVATRCRAARVADRSAVVRGLQSFEGVEPIEEGYNPATWVLDITNQSQERRLGLNFADEYEKSELYR